MKFLAGVALLLSLSFSAQAAPSLIYAQARQLLDAHDYLGFRIFVRESYYKKITQGEWYSVKNLVSSVADKIGYDMIPYWNARNTRGRAEADNQLMEVDKLMKEGNYEQAFTLAQSVAEKMKSLQRTRWDASIQLPYIFHSMGRALYGAQRYEEALKVYQWVGQKYPFFAQVLFEKMWAAFKAGRVDLALGAIASQRSAYFSKYLPPESYLIQSYLYRKLCRDDDQKQVIEEMKAYETVLSNPNSDLPLVTDVNTLVLSQVSNIEPKSSDILKIVPQASRDKEQKEIKETLKRVVEAKRSKNLKDLKAVIAYQQLSGQTDSKTLLKPVERMKSRDDLLKRNLEVWPAESSEEWMDEIGKHVLIGESLCNQQK